MTFCASYVRVIQVFFSISKVQDNVIVYFEIQTYCIVSYHLIFQATLLVKCTFEGYPTMKLNIDMTLSNLNFSLNYP